MLLYHLIPCHLVVGVVVTILDFSMGDQGLIHILVGLLSQITNRDPVHGPQRRLIAYPENCLPIIISSLLPWPLALLFVHCTFSLSGQHPFEIVGCPDKVQNILYLPEC